MERFQLRFMEEAKENGEEEEMTDIREEEDQIISKSIPQVDLIETDSDRKDAPKRTELSETEETVSLREIAKDLKKIKRQNFITQCLLSVLIVVTVTWQCGEASVLLSMKRRFTNPVQTIGDAIKSKLLGAKENGNGKKETIEGVSLPQLEMPNEDFSFLQLNNKK